MPWRNFLSTEFRKKVSLRCTLIIVGTWISLKHSVGLVERSPRAKNHIIPSIRFGNWQDFNWHDASRGPSAIAEFLVQLRMYARTYVRMNGRTSRKHNASATHRMDGESVFYRNGWMNQAVFWQGIFHRSILHCAKRKSGYLQKYGHFPLELCPKLRP